MCVRCHVNKYLVRAILTRSNYGPFMDSSLARRPSLITAMISRTMIWRLALSVATALQAPARLVTPTMSVSVSLTTSDACINLETTDEQGRRPLHMASISGDAAAAATLLDAGAQLDALDNDGISPLVYASASGHLDVAAVLCDHCAMAESFDVPAVQGGVDPVLQARQLARWTQRSLASPLHAAAAHGHVDVARLLIERGVSTQVTNALYETPLHLAAANGQHGTTVLLAGQQGCDAEDQYGDTPLFAACGSPECIEALLACGASVTATNAFGESALHHAAWAGDEASIQLLLDAGAATEIDRCGVLGESALHCAAQQGRVTALLALIESGATVELKNRHGIGVVDAAASGGYDDAAKVLSFYGGAEQSVPTRQRWASRCGPFGVPWSRSAWRTWLSLPRRWKAASRSNTKRLEPLRPRTMVGIWAH